MERENENVLIKEELQARIGSGVIGSSLVCLDTIDSTNTECKRRAAAGAAEGLVITAEEQTGGRGRMGRSFHSPKSKGIYYSYLLRPTLAPAEVVDLTAWIAVCVCSAIEKSCGAKPQIKWTNDIILGGKKLCGILTEMEIDAKAGSVRWVVPGIGINVNHQEEDFDPSIRSIATSLAMQLYHDVSRADLFCALTGELEQLRKDFPGNKEKYLERYRSLCVTQNCPVLLISPGQEPKEAYALGIDDEFRLMVRHADGTIEHIGTGEISVRGLCGYV